MPDALRQGVLCPTDPNESLTERLREPGVQDTIKKLQQLEKYLRGAVDAGTPAQALAWMEQQFGPRFPNFPDRVKVTSATAVVRATPAAVVATPLVGRTQAG